jgi:hypothetical protein
LKDFFTFSVRQSIYLELKVLIAGGNPRIPDFHDY